MEEGELLRAGCGLSVEGRGRPCAELGGPGLKAEGGHLVVAVGAGERRVVMTARRVTRAGAPIRTVPIQGLSVGRLSIGRLSIGAVAGAVRLEELLDDRLRLLHAANSGGSANPKPASLKEGAGPA